MRQPKFKIKMRTTSVEGLKDAQEKLKEMITTSSTEVRQLKLNVKNLEQYLKKAKYDLNRAEERKRAITKEFKRLKPRFQSRYYSHRRWATEHPIEALSNTLPKPPESD